MGPAFLETIEQTGLSTWIRESESVFAFYFILVFHTIGLGMVVGTSALVSLRVLGVASALPLAPLVRLYRLIWAGFWLNACSGTLLLIAYPTKALTNPVFYIKLTLVGSALYTMVAIKKRLLDNAGHIEPAMIGRARPLAICSLVLWCGAVMAGRLLAYTASYILYGKIT